MFVSLVILVKHSHIILVKHSHIYLANISHRNTSEAAGQVNQDYHLIICRFYIWLWNRTIAISDLLDNTYNTIGLHTVGS